MKDPVKIATLELENVKRVDAVYIEPGPNGLTVIGGKNGQGKTSVLDAIAWALGGGKFQPSQPNRDGAKKPPELKITLSNGLRVERKGKTSALTVTDPGGGRHGQTLLDGFISAFALDLPRFLDATDKEKAQHLLGALGVGDALAELDAQEKSLSDSRRAFFPIKESKVKHAAELTTHKDAPKESVSVSDLIRQQQAITTANAENAKKRGHLADLENSKAISDARVADLEARIAELQSSLATEQKAQSDLAERITNGRAIVWQLVNQSDAEIVEQIQNVEQINAKVAANQAKAKAKAEADEHAARYDEMTAEIERVRADRMALLEGAQLPLPGLTVEDGTLLYNGKAWDCMSGAEQLRVAVAIVRRLNGDCGFVLIDKLEQFDIETLAEFGSWLEGEGLQAIATRVSTGEECTIIIEDGKVRDDA